jgi:endonuclease-3
VDTHVIRFVTRFHLSDYKDPVRIEKDLMQLLPKREWQHFTHRVIFYGRYLAPARRYDVSADPLVVIYPPAAERFRV